MRLALSGFCWPCSASLLMSTQVGLSYRGISVGVTWPKSERMEAVMGYPTFAKNSFLVGEVNSDDGPR